MDNRQPTSLVLVNLLPVNLLADSLFAQLLSFVGIDGFPPGRTVGKYTPKGTESRETGPYRYPVSTSVFRRSGLARCNFIINYKYVIPWQKKHF